MQTHQDTSIFPLSKPQSPNHRPSNCADFVCEIVLLDPLYWYVVKLYVYSNYRCIEKPTQYSHIVYIQRFPGRLEKNSKNTTKCL